MSNRRKKSDADELPVISRTLDLLKWTSDRVAKFPASHRYTLGSRILDKLYAILDLLVAARFASDKASFLNESSLLTEQVRLSFRLACELRILSLSSHEHVSRLLSEIGRQIGGWKRHQQVVPEQ